MTALVAVTAPGDPIRHAALTIARRRLLEAVPSWELASTWASGGDTKAVEAELAVIADALAEPANDIEATGRCCCAGCTGMGPCDRADTDDEQ